MPQCLRAIGCALVTAVVAAGCATPSATERAMEPGPQGAASPKRIAVAIRGDPLHLSGRIGGAGAGSVPGEIGRAHV